MTPDLVLTDKPSDQELKSVVAGLSAYNLLRGVPDDWRPLAVLLKDGDRTIGGLTGWTMWSWLFVALFFIPGTERGRGLGTRILRMAEDEARRRGCVGVWLDTHSWQARPFYEKLGYTQFGELPDYPPGHSRYLVHKRL